MLKFFLKKSRFLGFKNPDSSGFQPGHNPYPGQVHHGTQSS